jgi:hypothetical protein
MKHRGRGSAKTGAVAASLLALFGSTAVGQHDLQTWCATGSTYSYGVEMDVVGDLDGDGIAELVIAATGSAFVQSAVDGRVLLTFDDDFGIAVAGAGDFDRDGTPDVLLAAIPSGSLPNGVVEIRSGLDGGLLLHVTGGPSSEFFGAALDVIGDADGDGIVDIVVGAPYAAPGGVTNAGRVVVCSGADGAVMHEHLGAVSNGFTGLDVAGVGDLDGDGRGDYAFQDATLIAPGFSQKLVRVMSGASGTTLYVFPPGPSTIAEVTFDSIGDVDGDAVPDIAIGFGSLVGVVRTYSGATGALIWERPGGCDGVTALGDVDADGVPDIGVYGPYVGASLEGKAGVTVLSGADGTALFHIGPKGKYGSWAGPGDLDGDGRGDLVIGSPNYSLPQPGSGCVTSVSLAPPVIATLTPQQPTIAESGDSIAHLTGSGFGYVGQVNIGATTFVVGTPAVSVWNPTQIDVAIPTATALGSEPITVSNTGAVPSNTVVLTYVETDPPVLKVPGLAFAGQPLTWSLFGGIGDHGFLLVAPDPSTIVFKGWPLLRNFVVLLPVPLDALGKAQLTLNLPAAVGGHSIYSQIATKDGVGFVGTSGIVWTYIG